MAFKKTIEQFLNFHYVQIPGIGEARKMNKTWVLSMKGFKSGHRQCTACERVDTKVQSMGLM